MEYRIRLVQDFDVASLVALCAEHAAYEKAEIHLEGKQERLRQAFASKRLYGWVVEINNQLLGYATVTIDYSTWEAREFVYMDCLYLKEHARGKGLGEKLLAEVAQLAKEKNCATIQWQTPTWNTRAMNFYQRLGASSKDKVRFFLEVQSGSNL